MEIRDYSPFRLEEILRLYESAGWTNYLKRADILEKAYANSLCVLAAYEDGKPVGIVRAVGDGCTIVFLQDLIVLPEYQHRGIGSRLLAALTERYRNVYQTELLTDDTEQTKAFYRSAGFTPADEIGCLSFIRM